MMVGVITRSDKENIMSYSNPVSAGEPVSNLQNLLRAVRNAPTHDALADAYMAARPQAVAFGLMGLLVDANTDALKRLPELEPAVAEPLAFALVDGVMRPRR
jgi:hypothetical protein